MFEDKSNMKKWEAVWTVGIQNVGMSNNRAGQDLEPGADRWWRGGEAEKPCGLLLEDHGVCCWSGLWGTARENSKGRSSRADVGTVCALTRTWLCWLSSFEGKSVVGTMERNVFYQLPLPVSFVPTHSRCWNKTQSPSIPQIILFLPPLFSWMIRISLSVNPVNCSLFPTSRSLMRLNIFPPLITQLHVLLGFCYLTKQSRFKSWFGTPRSSRLFSVLVSCELHKARSSV